MASTASSSFPGRAKQSWAHPLIIGPSGIPSRACCTIAIDSRNSCIAKRTVQHIAFLRYGYFELELFVTRVRAYRAEDQSRRPLPLSVGPLAPRAMASSAVMRATPLVRINPDGISRQQVFVLISTFEGKRLAKFPHPVKESQRRFQRNSANAEVRSHHALAADRLEQAQNIFTLAEAIRGKP